MTACQLYMTVTLRYCIYLLVEDLQQALRIITTNKHIEMAKSKKSIDTDTATPIIHDDVTAGNEKEC